MAEIRVEAISVDLPVFEVSGRSLRRAMARIGGRNKLAESDGVITVHALRDVDFTLSRGDRLGLIGQNGSGKSTLLRVLAGIYTPQKGKVTRTGRTVPLLDLALGLDDNSTGRQNIKLRGLFLGLDPALIASHVAEIIAFSELEEYIDLPVRTYSSGMRMRLAFSISMMIDADILLLDEIMAVGDSAFQAKARAKLRAVSDRAGIVVMALHSSPAILEFCNKVLWLQNGQMRMMGESHAVVNAYDDFMQGREQG